MDFDLMCKCGKTMKFSDGCAMGPYGVDVENCREPFFSCECENEVTVFAKAPKSTICPACKGEKTFFSASKKIYELCGGCGGSGKLFEEEIIKPIQIVIPTKNESFAEITIPNSERVITVKKFICDKSMLEALKEKLKK